MICVVNGTCGKDATNLAIDETLVVLICTGSWLRVSVALAWNEFFVSFFLIVCGPMVPAVILAQ